MSSENVLFIRFEETKENRIIKQAYKEQNKISELEYIKLFSKFLRSHFPELKFEIVFISKSWNDSVDEENNITTIREMPKNKISDYKVADHRLPIERKAEA